jgi:superfamily II DNA or RNA helicase
MKLCVGNTWTRVEGATMAEEQALSAYLTTEVSDYREARFGNDASWSTRQVTVYERGLFPTGLLRVVCRMLAEEGLGTPTVEYLAERPGQVQLERLPGWLRDYQKATASRGLLFGRGVLQVPMAGGKSEIFIAMTLALDVEWLYLVKSIDLVQQTAERYAKWTGETAGRFKQGEWTRGTSNVTVAGFDAVWRAIKDGTPGLKALAAAVEAINVDECHDIAAETLFLAAMAFERAWYRIGQSGTTLARGEIDNLRVIGALGPKVYQLPASELVERGEIAKTTVFMVVCDQTPRGDRPHPPTWRGVHGALIVKSTARNKLLAEMAQAAAKPCLLFVEQIRHGAAVVKELKALGLRAEFVNGAATGGARKESLRRLVEGEIEVLVANDIFRQGINAPALRSVVNGAGKQTAIGTLQRMGRAQRKKADGDNTCEVWDVDDAGNKWLARHADARRELYEAEGIEVKRFATVPLRPQPKESPDAA